MTAFKNATSGVKHLRIINIGFDGVAANIKLMRLLKGQYKEEGHEVIDFGSCFLHLMNNAIKTAHEKTNFGVAEYLEGAYFYFKYSSSKMSDLLQIDEKCELPLPFCTTRFLENIEPTKRLI